MTASCPVRTPEQAQYAAIVSQADTALRAAIDVAVVEAARASAAALAAAGNPVPAPAEDYFAAVAHQALFCRLCGAEPTTLTGGDAARAAGVIRNARNLARRHWGLDEQA